jgi:hypothetical protein
MYGAMSMAGLISKGQLQVSNAKKGTGMSSKNDLCIAKKKMAISLNIYFGLFIFVGRRCLIFQIVHFGSSYILLF